MAMGDHLVVKRFLYAHHGIDMGDGRVIHYSGTPTAIWNARVCITTLENFAGNGRVVVFDTPRNGSPAQIIERAQQRLGERRYNLISNNCEHFARWCRSGEAVCDQVSRWSDRLRIFGTMLQLTGNNSGRLLIEAGEFVEDQQPIRLASRR